MKKFVAALLTLALVLALASTAFAYVDKPLGEDGNGILVQFTGSAYGYKKVTNNYGKSKTSVALRKGTIATAVAIKGNWYKVQVPKSGNVNAFEELYFNKKYVTTKVKGEDLKYIFSSGGSGRSVRDSDPDYSESLAKKKLKVKTSGKVDLRKYNSLEKKSQGVVPSGKKVTVTGWYGFDNWGVKYYQVKYGKKTGYIAEVYIRSSDLKKIEKNIGE